MNSVNPLTQTSRSSALWRALVLLVALLTICWLPAVTHAATYYVDTSQPDDTGDGTTWGAAKKTIGAAISASAAEDTILVKYGTYLLSGASLSLDSDRRMSSDDGTHNSWDTATPDSSQCIIDAGYMSRVLTISGEAVTDATEIRGFMITGGDATSEALWPHNGGGILIADGADPIIENCWIRSNRAATDGFTAYGGGISVIKSGSTATIRDSHISENVAGTMYDAHGGGLYAGAGAGPVALLHNSITENTAASNRGGGGGGVCFYGLAGEIRYNTISYNTASGVSAWIAGGSGGGLYVYNNDNLIVWENTITHNTGSKGDQRAGAGGGLYCVGSPETDVWKNEISSNVASVAGQGRGGGVYNQSNAILRENVISDNTASTSNDGVADHRRGYGGGIFGSTSTYLYENTIASNTASLHGEGWGGGIWFGSGSEIERNLIYQNVASAAADGYGGGAYYDASYITQAPKNNTFYRNANTTSASGGGYGSGFCYVQYSGSPGVAINNIFACHDVENSDMLAVYSDVPMTISYNCFYENPSGHYNANVTSENEVIADPRLTDPDAGDFTLLYDSPVIEEGHPDTEVPENGAWRVDIGAIEYTGTRHLRAIPGTGEFLFGGQVKAKVNLTDLGTISAIDMIVHPGETYPEATCSVERWFDIAPTGGGATFDLTLSYKDSELAGHEEGSLNLWRWTGTGWEGPKVPSVFDTDDNWLTVSGETAFSDWVITACDPTAAVEEVPQSVDRFELAANAPNPFRSATMISFSIPEPSAVNLSVFDVTGRFVRTLASGRLPAGTYRVAWDGRDKMDRPVATGVYFYRLEASDFIETKRMLLLK